MYWNYTGALGRKLLLSILAFSFFITLVASGAVLYSDYQEELDTQRANLKQLEGGYLETVALSLWAYDRGQINSQLRGIANFPHVVFVRVTAKDYVASKGSLSSSNHTKNYSYELIHVEDGKPHNVGVLDVALDQEVIYNTIYKKAVVIVITQFFKTTLVSLFILILVNALVTRHLSEMAEWARGLDIRKQLVLNRSPNTGDEIGEVVEAINHLRSNLIEENRLKSEAKQQLEQVNKELESRVNERTKDLLDAIDRLNLTIDELKSTQSKLVEAEKMAALGQMVAGVAHELNTPIGICVTAQSYLNEAISLIDDKESNGSLTKDDFNSFLSSIRDGLGIMESNLSRSGALISSFKQLAIDRNNQVISTCSMTQLIKHVQDELAIELGMQKINVNLQLDEDIEIETFRDPLLIVMENLIRNSLVHGFKGGKGTIYINISESESRLFIDYRDDGEGIPKEVQESIFDPFVTTERRRGQAGLGMHLVYNLVTQVLDGTISCLDSDNGAHFSIEISKRISEVLDSPEKHS